MSTLAKPLLIGLALILSACGGKDVTYRLEQNDPSRDNTIGITNSGGQTHAYGNIGFSTGRSY